MKKYINTLLAGAVGALIVLSFAATSYDMKKGIDLTGQSSVSASMLNQLVDNSVVGDNRGMIIYTNSAPTSGGDIAANPRLKRFIWLDSSQSPPAIYTWNTNTTNWAAIGLAADSVNSSHIVDYTIATADIATNAITSDSIAANAVGSDEVQTGAIINAKIGLGAVTAASIYDGTILLADMAADSINSSKIVDASVASVDVAVGGIEHTNLAVNSVTRVKIATDSVATTNIIDDAVSLDKLNSGDISAFQVLRGNSAGTAYEAVNQSVIQQTTAYTTNAYNVAGTAFTMDDNPVTSAEGAEITELQTSFTPKSASSTLLVEFHFCGEASTTMGVAGAIFKDSDSNASAISYNYGVTGYPVNSVTKLLMTSGTTSTIVFKARVAQTVGGANPFYFNQSGSGTTLGSAQIASLTVTELQ